MRSSFHGMLFLAMACLMLMPVWQPLYGQDEGTPIEISGVVVDQGGEPLPGVNVVIKGTYRGTITDINGRFSIAAKTGDVLTVSYIGFTTQEIPVTGQATLNLTLQEDIAQLEEVVIVGYGEVKRVNLLGSVESILSENFIAVSEIAGGNLCRN